MTVTVFSSLEMMWNCSENEKRCLEYLKTEYQTPAQDSDISLSKAPLTTNSKLWCLQGIASLNQPTFFLNVEVPFVDPRLETVV